MREFLLRYLLVLLGLLVLSMPAAAQEDGPLVKIRLLPEKSWVGPGEEIWVGIEEAIAEHWHTYWKNPGDSGAILRAKWTLPDGFEISALHWPTPQKIPYEPLVNYGYEGQVMLLQKLKVPENLPDGPLTLSVDIEVLVCREECIPEYGTYSVTLNAVNAMQEDNTPYIEAALDKLPKPFEGSVFYDEVGSNFALKFTGLGEIKAAEFFPEEWGLIENPAMPEVMVARDGAIVLMQARGERDLAEIGGVVKGVLVYDEDGVRKGYAFEAKEADLSASNSGAVKVFSADHLGLGYALLFALIGGLILNLMPCVFPVLSLKALSLVKIAEKHPEKARMHGVAYTLGVVLSFMAIAGILIALKSGGAQIGWGFQLQNPFIVGLLAYLLFVIGLNLAGLFEFANPFGNAGAKLAGGSGYKSSFFTGVLATVVATPCTAPFMAGAVGFALVQSAYISLLIFAMLGFGLALPYLLLSIVPGLQKMLPKPGAWMDVFKQLLAFPMFAASVWLVWVMGTQTGVMGMGSLMAGMVCLAFAIWLLRHKPADKFWRRFVKVLAIIALLFSVIFIPKLSGGGISAAMKSGAVFSQEALDMLLEEDAPVFVEMTASWCITCKVNHALAIDVPTTRTLFAARQVRYLIGDWTNEDPEITAFLESYGRSGVPLYVYYGPRGSDGARPAPVILPQVLTSGTVAKFIK